MLTLPPNATEAQRLHYTRYVRTLPRLKALREAAPLTQEELANKAHINRVTIARLEAGSEAARPSTVRKLAKALRVTPAALFGDA